jgi:hypothetical protein
VKAGVKLRNDMTKYRRVQSRRVYRLAQYVDHDALDTVLDRFSAQVIKEEPVTKPQELMRKIVSDGICYGHIPRLTTIITGGGPATSDI